MATIQDVARHAGVGAATVSRVLSGRGYVKAETKDRVMASIRELNYTPNEMARNLYYRKSGIIAVVVPDLSHPFYAQLVREIEDALRRDGYQAMVCNAFYEADYELHCLDMLRQQRVDGLIFGAHTSLVPEAYEKLERPVIGLDRILSDKIPFICTDHEEGGRLAARELIGSGCRCLVQAGDNEDSVITPSSRRHSAFRREAERSGVPCLSYPAHLDFGSYEAYRECVEGIFREHPEADGFFGTDLYAAACLQMALERGIRVPEDLKIVSYDGTWIIRFFYPGMTCVCQPIREMAGEAVRLMTELIRGNEPSEKKIVLPVSFRRGKTTGDAVTE